MDDDPVLVTSNLPQRLEEDGHVFEINIFRLEDEERWTLEVVDRDGTSHVWDEPFASDSAAFAAASSAIRGEGPEAFMSDGPPPTLH